MRAMLSHAPGGPQTLRLETVPDPTPAKGQVVIDVKACGVNFPDVLIIEDKYQFKPAASVRARWRSGGYRCSAVGESVTDVKVGDRVLASGGWGGMAEKMVVDAWQMHENPGRHAVRSWHRRFC